MREDPTSHPMSTAASPEGEPRQVSRVTVFMETWLLWVLVTGLSWPVSLLLLSVIAQQVENNLLHWIGLLAGGILGGLFLSGTQWLVMRPVVVGFSPWVGYSSPGWMLGIAIAAASLQPEGAPLLWALAIFIGGSVYGLSQWLAMKPGFRGRGEWVFLTGITWGLAVALGLLLDAGVEKENGLRAAGDPTGLGMIGWPVLSILAFFIFITIFSTTSRKIKSRQMGLAQKEDRAPGARG